MKSLRSLLVAGIALALSGAPARAITYPVLADTAGSPKTTRIAKLAGRATTLPVSANSNAYIAFGVAGSLNAPTPDAVTAARLIIYFQTVTKPGMLTVFLAKANEVGQFTETFTTPTQGIPAQGANIAINPTFGADATLKKGFYIIDVTAEVKGWLTNPASEFGFGIKSDGVANVLLGAKEGSGSGYPAELEIDVATAGTKGDKGDKGDPGLKGDKGDPGTNGTNGTNGINGTPGTPGTNGTNGKDGTTPVVAFGSGAAADQLSINGTVSGPHLTGPAGPATMATLADGSVTTAKLADSSVTPAKLNLLTGNVGIGTATPGYRLTVQTAPGVGGLVHTDGTISVGTLTVPSAGMGWLGTFSNHALGFFTNNTGPRMTIVQSGNVGINTMTPVAWLDVSNTGTGKEHLRLSGTDVAGNSDANGISLLLGSNRGGPSNRQLWIGDSFLLASNTTNPIIRIAPLNTAAGGCLIDAIATNGTTSLPLKIGSGGVLFISAAGNVGIGNTSPTQARLVVNNNGVGSVPLNQQHGYLGTGGAQSISVTENIIDNSIYADGNILAFQYYAFSDERIKNIRGRSDGATDLATLAGIEITDYTMKDSVAQGARPHKKVIAQQVEKVFPQAVSRTTDVVPDIYKKATVQDGWVQLATDLKVGERVRLIATESQGIHEVLAVRDGAFRTDFQPASAEVFVYGREVKDFRQVDYEAIAMLNVSATQELARRLDAKDALIDALTRKLAALEAQTDKTASKAPRSRPAKRAARGVK